MHFSFLGLGNMGAPLAMNLLKAGEKLNIYTRRDACAEDFTSHGATAAAKIADLADCDVLCTCLPMPQHVMDTVLGSDGLYAKMRPGSIWSSAPWIRPRPKNSPRQQRRAALAMSRQLSAKLLPLRQRVTRPSLLEATGRQ